MPVSNESHKVAEQIGLPGNTSINHVSKFISEQTDELENRMIRNLCNYIESGSFNVVYWDGTEEKYGEGDPFFKLIIYDKSIIGRLVKDPTLVFGEAYVDGLIELEGDIEQVIKLIHLNKNLINKFAIGKTVQKVTSNLRKPSIRKQKKISDIIMTWITISLLCGWILL